MRQTAIAVLTVSVLMLMARLASAWLSADPPAAEGRPPALSAAERETPFDGVRY